VIVAAAIGCISTLDEGLSLIVRRLSPGVSDVEDNVVYLA